MFARNLLDKERSGTLETPVEEVERYLHETHSDPSREVVLGDSKRIEPAAPPVRAADLRANLWGSEGSHQESKIWFSSRTQCYPVQSVQDVPTPAKAAMEVPQGSLEER